MRRNHLPIFVDQHLYIFLTYLHKLLEFTGVLQPDIGVLSQVSHVFFESYAICTEHLVKALVVVRIAFLDGPGQFLVVVVCVPAGLHHEIAYRFFAVAAVYVRLAIFSGLEDAFEVLGFQFLKSFVYAGS